MLKLSNLKANGNLISTVSQTAVLIIFSMLITIVHCSMNNSEFNWLTFTMTFLLSNYSKAIFVRYKSNVCLKNDDIVQKQIVITKDKNWIFQNNKTEEFKEELRKINETNKLDAIIDYCYRKKNKEDLLQWAFDIKKGVENNKYSLNSIHIRYNHIKYTTLLTAGKSDGNNDKQYVFSGRKASLNRSLGSMMMSFVISYLFSTLVVNDYVASGQVWLDLGTYLMAITTGIASGISIGEKIILEDYYSVLENVASLIREIKGKIEQNMI